MKTFSPYVIFHVDDDPTWRKAVYRELNGSQLVKSLYKDDFIWNQLLMEELKDDPKEYASTILEAQKPMIVSFEFGQPARSLLDLIAPGILVSDTNFQMNGAETVRWMCEHGYRGYALVGLSGTPLSDVPPDLRDYFMTTPSVYFEKALFSQNREYFFRFVKLVRDYNQMCFGNPE